MGDGIQPSHPLLPPSPPALNLSPNQGLFQCQFFASGGQGIGSFSFNICPSNEYSGPISFRMDWLDLLAVQGTLKSLLQHHSSKASILQHSAFFNFVLITSLSYGSKTEISCIKSVQFSCSVMSSSLRPHGLIRAYWAPWSMGFSRQEYWSGLPFPEKG